MPRYMLDTDICAYLIRGTSPALDEQVRRRESGALCVSAVTRAELLCGVRRKLGAIRLGRLVAAFLERSPSLPWTDECAGHYAEIRASLERRGRLIGNLDLVISAHACATRLILVTNNERHFAQVSGLRLENWSRSH